MSDWNFEAILFWIFQALWSTYLSWWIFYSAACGSVLMTAFFTAMLFTDFYLALSWKGYLK